ncbi:MAG: hypothetical protein ABUK13_09925, partial [Gammaproteobacteria bacterium]
HPRASYSFPAAAKKYQKNAAPTPYPAGTQALQLYQRVGSTRVLLDEPHNSSLNCDPTKVEALGKANRIKFVWNEF